MRRVLVVIASALGLGLVFAGRGLLTKIDQKPTEMANESDSHGARIWPNGWRTSAQGSFVSLPGDMPATIIPLPDGNRALVNTCGYHDHSVSLVDLTTGTVLNSVVVPRLWLGMSFDPATNEVLVSSGSGRNLAKPKKKKTGLAMPSDAGSALLRYKVADDKLTSEPGLQIPGINLDDQFVSSVLRSKSDLFIANIQSDTVYRLSPDGSAVRATGTTGYRPYALALSTDGKTLAASNWGDKSVSLLDSATLVERARVKVGSHPNAMLYLPDGRLVVANAGSDTLSVLDGNQVTETVRTSILSRDPIGAAPIALVYSASRKQIFAANSDNNSIAVIDVHQKGNSSVMGFIPTGRYPSALALSVDGRQIIVGTAKGLSSALSAGQKEASEAKMENGEVQVPYKYVGNILSGDLAILPLPDKATLAKFSHQVMANRPDGSRRLNSGMSPGLQGALRQIKHVVYVIKENRTFDQVLGDDPRGNGDKDLVMFGQNVTPNEHKIVRDFVLFDNIYTDGEVSQVGHQWTDAGYAGDYTEKQWLLEYGDHEEVKSDTRLSSSPGGFIWQNAKKHGKSARIYGEYLEWQEDHTSAHGEVKKDPEKFGCSAAFEEVFARGGRDTEKVDVFLSELKQAEKTGRWPNMMVMALNEDHTRGMSPGSFTPQAMVASNDLAVGKLVEGISHSTFWASTAVFIIEDDAQDGPDHVDCHRTTGYLVCPLVKRGMVDHTMYSTSSMIRTMNLMLGLPPLSQYDANAMPMLPCMTAKPDLTPFDFVPPQIDLLKKCPKAGSLAMRSSKLDFSDMDKADPNELNDILWKAIHPGKPTPAPVHGLLQ